MAEKKGQVYAAAADLLECAVGKIEGHWAQGDAAFFQGRFCVMTGLGRCYDDLIEAEFPEGSTPAERAEYNRVFEVACESLREQLGIDHPNQMIQVVWWNDAEKRTEAEVLSMMRAAATSARNKEAAR